jgi:hypothetical protein
MKSILILSLLFITLHASSFNHNEELQGRWTISDYKQDKRISFLNLIGNEINISFNSDKTITSNNGYLKNIGFEYQNNKLIFGVLRKDKISYNKSIYKLNPNKKYINGLSCYLLKPIKISSGFYSKKQTYKLCRNKRRYINKTY